MDKKTIDWRDEGKHLPEFLRDFHDQKDFFKFLFDSVDTSNNPMLKNANWVDSQVFTIDMLLWKLAQYGYTLQKNKTKVPFEDLQEALRKNDAERRNAFYSALTNSEKK